MGQFTFSVSEAGQPDLSKTVSLSDADIERIVATYQSPANVMVNGTATRQQVFDYMLSKVIGETNADVVAFFLAQAQAAVQQPAPLAVTE